MYLHHNKLSIANKFLKLNYVTPIVLPTQPSHFGTWHSAIT